MAFTLALLTGLPSDIAFALGAGVLSLLFAILYIATVLKKDQGNEKMQEIARAIREGAMAYLKREYTTIAVFTVVIAALLGYFLSVPLAVTFLGGAVLSALAGYIGMAISVRANVRTAAAASKGLRPALDVAFKGGGVTGFFVVGLALIGVTGFLWLYQEPLLLIGFGFGASLISLFARIGGGIYTKAADVGADLVGKVEAGIPEDDPRNPGVIADNVGDNVGDCAGMAADLFETYAVSLIGAMLLGSLILGEQGISYPLQIGAGAIIASIIGSFFARGSSIMKALYTALLISAVAAVGIFALLIESVSILAAAVVGIIIALLLFGITEYYTSKKYSPVRSIAEAAQTGPGTNLITGLAVGMKSTWAPVLVIALGILASFWLAGIYGIAIAVMAMLSLTGVIITMDAYGPITDNAGGIAEMAGLPKKTRQVTDALDAVGNTTKAVTKTFAIGSAALAALTLFAAYVQELEIARSAAGLVGTVAFSLTDPLVVAGLFIGGLIPFVFGSILMSAVGKGAHAVVEEVRSQFKDGLILKGKKRPDYGRTVDIVTKRALREMAIPALLAVLAPLVVGFLLGPIALGGLLMGSIVSGLLLALQMATGGAAWDNAKKYIEDGHFGGKGSPTHKAAVVGDTVGDPYKDTAGPAINPLIKVMNTVAIIAISLIVLHALV
ncbi:MAG: sodium-translocating pyrophosphatase [Candidatus Aenigmarchaeota archaeon]|nr:sodium-translocating pyrophosphatase [Candidatus Aenigmarchaeota archaeon]